MGTRGKAWIGRGGGLALLLLAAPAAAPHPHFSPEAMLQRIREIDAILLAAPPAGAAEKALLLEEQGQLLDGIGRLAEAMAAFEEAVRLAPEDARTLYNFGTLLLGRGLCAAAEPWLQRAARLEPREVRHLELLAQARARAGRLEPAARTWLEAVQVEKNPALQAEKLGAAARALEEAGRSAEARKLLDRAVALTPGDPLWLLERARFLARAGEPLGAAADFGRVAQGAPKHPDLHVWQVERGEALLKAGRRAEAAPVLEGALDGIARLLGEDPAFPEDLCFHKARALHGLGRTEEAARALGEALKVLPGEPSYLKLGQELFAAAGAPAESEKCRRALAEEARRMEEGRREDREDQEQRDREIVRQVDRARFLARVQEAVRKGTGVEEALEALAGQGPEGLALARRARSSWLERCGRAAEALALLASLPAAETREEAWVAGLRLRCLKALGREAEAGPDRKLVESYLEAARK